jgi:hypothetical protein
MFYFFLCLGQEVRNFKENAEVSDNGWRYEKLPIAGDFLSIHTKVEASYNP